MNLRFKTNLDEAQNDVFRLNADPSDGAPIPRKGERIAFPFTRGGASFRYELEVCAVTYDFAGKAVEVELHIPSYCAGMTIADWTAWFNRHRHGRGLPDSPSGGSDG